MLVLGRKKGDRIIIGDEMIIEVVAVQNEIVKLGIIAPRDVAIHRDKIYDLNNGPGASERLFQQLTGRQAKTP